MHVKSKSVSLLVLELDAVLADDTGLAGTGDGDAEAGRVPLADGVSTGHGAPFCFDGVLVDKRPAL